MGASVRKGLRASVAGVLATGAVLALGACGGSSEGDADLVAGKQLFVERCGSCHVLNRAGTKGLAGPDLDQAFARALTDGMPRSGIRGAIYGQILYPADFEAEGAKRVDNSGAMPAKLVNGEDAQNVAAYVASVVGRKGKDSGLLAGAVKQAGGGAPAEAKNGVLSIAADPGGQLAYVTNRASAPSGELKVESPNESNVPHNIVIDGKGTGEVVQNGGVSEFTAEFEAGEYPFYCSVPGHREEGIERKSGG